MPKRYRGNGSTGGKPTVQRKRRKKQKPHVATSKQQKGGRR